MLIGGQEIEAARTDDDVRNLPVPRDAA